MKKEEIELILDAQRGNKEALEKIIKNEQNNIYTTIFYLKQNDRDVYDIMQNVLIKIVQKIHQLKNPDLFKTWLNKIILHTYYDYMRKNKNDFKNKSISEINTDIVDFKYNPSDDALYSELDFKIKQTISNMPIHYKIPIALREIQGLSYETISSITNTSVGTIKSRIARARGIIKNEIKRYTR